MLITYELSDANPILIPTVSGVQLSAHNSPMTSDEIQTMKNIPYQNAIGALNHYMIMTRPDISLAIQKVSQFIAKLGSVHWIAVQCILHYLKGMYNHMLTVGGHIDVTNVITAYCDADHANSPDHSHSISGYVIFAGCSTIAWSAKKQMATAWSTAEAEYYTSVRAGQEIAWLCKLLAELGFLHMNTMMLNIDNTSAIWMIT